MQTTHRAVDLLTFTGESNTERVIAAAAAPTLKKFSFELGSKGANIVFSDADWTTRSSGRCAPSISTRIKCVLPARGYTCTSRSLTRPLTLR